MKGVSNKVQKAVQLVKNKVNNLNKSSKNNEIKINVNNKEASKQITQLEKEIDSLQKKITARQVKLDIINPQIDKIINDTRDEVTPEGVPKNNKSMDSVVDNALSSNKNFTSLSAQAQKLYIDIETYNNQLNEAKSKISQLKQEINKSSSSQNKLTSFFNIFKKKLEQTPKITQSITNNIKNMQLGLKSGLKHILRYAMALFSLRGIYSVLSNSARAWLSSQNSGAQQLSANIEYMKYAMGSVFAPIIQYVTNLIYKLMKAIQSVLYAFSGINIFAKATASSMNKTAGSASKASKSLTGVHNEINNVSENNSTGGSGTPAPSMDLSQVDNEFATKIKKWVKELKVIPNIINNIKKAWKNAWKSNGEKILKSIKNVATNVFKIFEGGLEAIEQWTESTDFQEFINSILELISTLLYWVELVTQKIREIWENSGKQTFSNLLNFISKLLTAISSIISFLSPVVEFILNVVTPVIDGIIKYIGYLIDALSGVLDFIIGVFTGDWEKSWNGIKEIVSGVWNAIKSIIKASLDAIVAIVKSGLTIIKEVCGTVWKWLKDFANTTWNGIKNIISNIINSVKNIISDVLNSIKNVWNKVWGGLKTTVTNIFNGIWTTIKGVINSILGGIEGMANGVVKGINKVISVINNLSFDIPDWVPEVGGNKFGFNIKYMNEISIPRLAKGNVAYSPMIAQFGEYIGASSNPEITTPQNIMRETFEDVLTSREWGNNNNSNGEIKQVVFQFGSYRVAIEMEKLLQQARRQNGVATVTV